LGGLAGKRYALLGICGVYCGACSTFRAFNDADEALIDWELRMGMPEDEIMCEGCYSGVVNKWCSKCQFRRCTEAKGINYCLECGDFPCKKLLDFSRTRPHRTLGLRNLQHLKNLSISEWLKEQEQRWRCSNCGKKLHWYAEKCPDCGNPFLNATEEGRAARF
jgi:hypothetical protein